MLRNHKNVACCFGSDVTKNGKFHSVFIRDGEVFTSELASRTVELMGLDKGNGAITEFGEAKAKQDNIVELSQLKLGHKNEDKKFPEITVSVDAIRRIGDHRNLSLRHISRGTAKARLGDYTAAIKDYDEAIRLDPKSLKAKNAQAIFLATAADAETRSPARA